MIRFDYNQSHYENLIKHYARQFRVKLKNNSIHLPENIGSGIIRVVFLSNGLQVFISNYTLQQDLLLYRKKSVKDFFLLRFEEMIISSAASNSKSAILLSVTNHDQMFLHPAGTQVKVVSALFNKDWLSKFLMHEDGGDVIIRHLSSNVSSFSYEPMDAEYRRLMYEMMNITADKCFEQLIIQNRMMLMMERFFSRLYWKVTNTPFNIHFSDEEILRLKDVETHLLKDLSAPPSITELGKIAAMSPSKLQTSFKEMFGLPVHQYFQKHRMNKAKAMLLSKKYSVADVVSETGFSNLKTFTKTFHEAFDQLPEDVIRNF